MPIFDIQNVFLHCINPNPIPAKAIFPAEVACLYNKLGNSV
jgi:hypothetical protein